MNYEQRTMNYAIKNKPKTNPIQSQTNPISEQNNAKYYHKHQGLYSAKSVPKFSV